MRLEILYVALIGGMIDFMVFGRIYINFKRIYYKAKHMGYKMSKIPTTIKFNVIFLKKQVFFDFSKNLSGVG